MRNRLIPQAGFLLLCSAIGVGIACFAVRTVQLETGKRKLMRSAEQLLRKGDRLQTDERAAIHAVANDGLPFCSAQEISFMRDYVFRSSDIRDIGRTKDGLLYCTTGMGMLAKPVRTPKPDMVLSTGEKIFISVPLLISPHSTGFIVENDGVNAVFNADMLRDLGRLTSYRTLLWDRRNNRMVLALGPDVPLHMGEILAQKLIERDGIFYQPLCSATTLVCQIAMESRSVMLAQEQGLWGLFLFFGGAMGVLFGLIVLLVRNKHRSLENQLRRAVHRDLLTLVYQPVVSLETRKILGAETLVRWISEDGELIRPDVFIALAEGRGFVNEITQMVLRKVIAELGDLLAAGKLQVTINITAQDLEKPEFAGQLEQNIIAAGIRPEKIGLELTERSTANQENVLQALAKLKSVGYRVYIDDFGTGYSSLAYLHQMQIDAIKVDQSFTQTVGTGAVTASVVPQILAMAEQLGLLVVVEGIETEEQAAYFRSAGRGILGQGWLFGKPVPAAQFRRMLMR